MDLSNATTTDAPWASRDVLVDARRALEVAGRISWLMFWAACDWDPARRARRLRVGLEALGPAFVKVGQLLALHTDLPGAYRSSLRGLLDATAPLPFAVVERVIHDELGALAGRFASIEEAPLASASIGQVHRARLHDGRTVVIKVQRPRAAAAMQRDLTTLERLVRRTPIAWVLRTSRAALMDIVEEVADFSRQELDYRREATMQTRFRALELDGTRTPEVYEELSTARVLTSEFLPGVTVNRVLDRRDDAAWLEAHGIDLDMLAERLARLQIAQALEHGFFQADPHPANLILMDGQIVGYVDFGIVGELDDAMRRDIVDLVWYELIGAYERVWPILGRYLTVPRTTDFECFKTEFVALSRRYKAARGAGANPRGLGAYVEDQMRLYHRHRLRMHGRWATYLRAVLVYGNSVAALSPRFDFMQDTAVDYLRLKLADFFDLTPSEQVRTIGREALLLGAALSGDRDLASLDRNERAARRADLRVRCGIWCALSVTAVWASVLLRHDAAPWAGGWTAMTAPLALLSFWRLAAGLRRLGRNDRGT